MGWIYVRYVHSCSTAAPCHPYEYNVHVVAMCGSWYDASRSHGQGSNYSTPIKSNRETFHRLPAHVHACCCRVPRYRLLLVSEFRDFVHYSQQLTDSLGIRRLQKVLAYVFRFARSCVFTTRGLNTPASVTRAA